MIGCPDVCFFMIYWVTAVRGDEVALTVNIQPGGTGHNPGFILGWYRVPPSVFFCSSLNEQADVAMIILVHAGEMDKVIRVLNF